MLYLHPFAEELNKSRRMVALQIRALAAAGYDVLQIDLFGCGDSSGDFENASWDQWLTDGQLGVAWLQANSGAPLWLWGLRCGALLAADLSSRLSFEISHLYWQPLLTGEAVLRDFQRLAIAGEILSGRGKEKRAEFKARLVAGMPIEVAGYTLSPALANRLGTCRLLDQCAASPARTGWLDIVSDSHREPSPVVAEMLATLQARGCRTNYAAVTGSAFWLNNDIETLPGLIEQTVRVLSELS